MNKRKFIRPILKTTLEYKPRYYDMGLTSLLHEFGVRSLILSELISRESRISKAIPFIFSKPNSFDTLGIQSKICKSIYSSAHIPLNDQTKGDVMYE